MLMSNFSNLSVSGKFCANEVASNFENIPIVCLNPSYILFNVGISVLYNRSSLKEHTLHKSVCNLTPPPPQQLELHTSWKYFGMGANFGPNYPQSAPQTGLSPGS